MRGSISLTAARSAGASFTGSPDVRTTIDILRAKKSGALVIG